VKLLFIQSSPVPCVPYVICVRIRLTLTTHYSPRPTRATWHVMLFWDGCTHCMWRSVASVGVTAGWWNFVVTGIFVWRFEVVRVDSLLVLDLPIMSCYLG
jgi:hypothetical protein